MSKYSIFGEGKRFIMVRIEDAIWELWKIREFGKKVRRVLFFRRRVFKFYFRGERKLLKGFK